MKILIDFTQIPVVRTGVGVYSENLIRELVQLIRPEDVLFLLIQDDEVALREIGGVHPNIQFVSIPSRYFRKRALLFAFEQFILPVMLLRKRIDVLHSLHYTHPFISPSRRVVTIHDLTFLLYPELHTLGRRLIMPLFIRHAVRHVEAVIFVSNSAREDANRLVPGGKALESVIPLGVNRSLFEAPDCDEIQNVLQKLNIERPFLLFIGTIEPRKNIIRLVQAFEMVADKQSGIVLVLAGKFGWDYAEVLDAIENSRHRNRIRLAGFITDVEKKALLNSCEILVYPSLYEGFGLPVLEAMAAGAPVITSNLSSLPEVSGNAGILINPKVIPLLVSAIFGVLASAEKKIAMRTDGKQRASLFTWKNTARLTYETYCQVLGIRERHDQPSFSATEKANSDFFL
ncbi:glycosyltransferase family 1 protein [Acidobacterium sp. S8]|uniref:glycosyltransferase family 4 protein n=1 Tax=Acidobacterium sp. S8 TaxID=1641854 RepID=UPI00131E7842|nr:glycosyltransferase family 1 protein [Acidobacterium sp. S8]